MSKHRICIYRVSLLESLVKLVHDALQLHRPRVMNGLHLQPGALVTRCKLLQELLRFLDLLLDLTKSVRELEA